MRHLMNYAALLRIAGIKVILSVTFIFWNLPKNIIISLFLLHYRLYFYKLLNFYKSLKKYIIFNQIKMYFIYALLSDKSPNFVETKKAFFVFGN